MFGFGVDVLFIAIPLKITPDKPEILGIKRSAGENYLKSI